MRKAKFATVGENTECWPWNGYRKADQKIDIDIDDISKISIEIDRNFLGAYRPITNCFDLNLIHQFNLILNTLSTVHLQIIDLYSMKP